MRIGLILPHTMEELGLKNDEDVANYNHFTDNYAKYLIKLGHSVTTYNLCHGGKIREIKHKYGHTIVRCPVNVSFGLGRQFSFALLRRLWRDAPKTDVFHIMGYYCMQYDTVAITLRLRRKPLITHYHSGDWNLRNPMHLARIAMLSATLRLASKVLVCRHQEKDMLKRLIKVEADFFPNGVDTSVFGPVQAKKKPYSLLCIARLMPVKEIPLLLDAFVQAKQKIPTLSLTLVGRGPLEEEILSKIKTEDIKGVTRMSFAPLADMPRLYASHDIFVLPSRWEGFPLSVLESLACATPCLITENDGATIFRDKYLKVVPVHDKDALANEIVSMLKDRKKLAEMGKKGSKEVLKNHDWKDVVKKLEDEYSLLVDRHKAAGI